MASSVEKVVAEHYNALPKRTLKERSESRIFYLRNLNNWIKSMLIQDGLNRRREQVGHKAPICVLDLCCGKGGDMLKWKNGHIDHLVCCDVADVSVQQCKERYRDLRHRARFERRTVNLFDAEFVTADCSVDDVSQKCRDPDIQFDLCSCQFSLHYCFASEAQARQLLRNACSHLKVGGYFLGTIPDANAVVKLLRSSADHQFSNQLCTLRLVDCHPDSIPLFGAKYDFQLDEVVNCPEYLVYFPLLVKLLQELGMQLVYKKNFAQMVDTFATPELGKALMAKMQALEPYPRPTSDQHLAATAAADKSQYCHAEQRIQQLSQSYPHALPISVGTVSADEWTVACLYVGFMFKKVE